MSIFGGNFELIRIVNNSKNEARNIKFSHKAFSQSNIQILTILKQAIKNHQNDLFDWIFEQNYNSVTKQNNDLYSLIISSIENGNAHTLVHLIDNGFDFQNYSNDYSTFIKISSENGFYLLDELLISLINKNSTQKLKIESKSSVWFGNLSIFKLFEQTMNQNKLDEALTVSIIDNKINIIKYFFETLINQRFQLSGHNSFDIIRSSIKYNSELLNYIIEKVNYSYPIKNFNTNSIKNLLSLSIEQKIIKTSIYFCDLLYENNHNNNFTGPFASAFKYKVKEVFDYILQNKFRLKYDILNESFLDAGSADVSMFSTLIKKVNCDLKKRLLGCINSAIQNKNKPLIEYLLKEGSISDDSLVKAVNSDDLEIVEMILKYNQKPSFINAYSFNGTALKKAVEKNNIPIVKKLLSLPGIDPSVFGQNLNTPLVTSANQYNYTTFKLIIDFYGENIKHLMLIILFLVLVDLMMT